MMNNAWFKTAGPVVFLLAQTLFAAIPSTAVWSIKQTATAGNVNGAIFDTGASFPITNGSMTGATGSSPVLSTASYTFVAGDVGHWIYTVSNTGGQVVRGRWKISSVNAGAATLDASVGAATYHNATTRTWTVNSLVAGVASVASPTSITFGIDYTDSAAALCAITDLVIDGTTSTNVTSSGCPFGINHTGNGMKVASGTGFTVDWFVIQSVSGVIATLDKPAGTLSSTGGVAKLAGSASLQSSSGATDDSMFEKGIAGNDWFIAAATYTMASASSVAATGSTSSPINVYGYNTVRGDNPIGSSRPLIDMVGNGLTFGTNWNVSYLSITGTQNPVFTSGTSSVITHVKVVNTSTTASRSAISMGSNSECRYCEAVAFRGRAFHISGTAASLLYSYAHDSDVGVNLAANGYTLILGVISAHNVTAAVNISASLSAPMVIDSCTLFGATYNPGTSTNGIGTGIAVATGVVNLRVSNSIISGFATGVSVTDSQTSGRDYSNYYYGNNVDVNSNWSLGYGSATGTNPSFTDVSQYYGTGATSSTNVLTVSGTPFSTITDNVDYVTLISGSGTGFTAGKYLITGHTSNTLTVSNNITSSGSGSSIVWEVTYGHNFGIGTTLSQTGYPGLFPGGFTTSYRQTGAVGKQAAGSGGTRIYFGR